MRNTGAIPKNPIKYLLALTEFLALEPKLVVANHRSMSPIVGDGDANVSLTSYGKRIATVWKTIETIGAGNLKPRRIILWLDDAAALADPPATLKRLCARGLEFAPAATTDRTRSISRTSARSSPTNPSAPWLPRTTMSSIRRTGSKNYWRRTGPTRSRRSARECAPTRRTVRG
ncbi:MAG: hypothetical protein K2Y33_04370 [Mycolicibacterium frederiksbergense]|nr:hypothetical protein [Mycolicibacterium frederiksbergense]